MATTERKFQVSDPYDHRDDSEGRLMFIKDVSELLRQHRKQQGLTQEGVGKILGISKSAVCKLEKEDLLPSLQLVVKIAAFLGEDSITLSPISEMKVLGRAQTALNALRKFSCLPETDRAILDRALNVLNSRLNHHSVALSQKGRQ